MFSTHLYCSSIRIEYFIFFFCSLWRGKESQSHCWAEEFSSPSVEDAFLGFKLIRLNNLWPFKFLSSQILLVSLNHLFISFWNLNFSLNSAVYSCKSRPLSVVHALPKLPAAFCSTCIPAVNSPLAVHTCSPFLSFHVCSAST